MFKLKMLKMHVSSKLVLAIIPLFVLTSYSQEDDAYLTLDLTSIDRSNYVDPHDMFNYDRKEIQGTRKEKFSLKTSFDKDIPQELNAGQIDREKGSLEEEDVPVQVVVYEKTISKPMPECLNDKPANCSCTNNTTLELPFLGRFVRILSTKLQLKEKPLEDGDVLYIPLLAVINTRTQFVLSELVKDKKEIQLKYLADLDEILTNLLILNEDKLECQPDLSFIERILKNSFLRPKDWIVAMFIASLWLVLWLTFKGYSYSYILSRSFLFFFIICWFWHWNYMDQVASSKRYSDMSKNAEIPASCNPEQLDILESLKLKFNAFWGHPDPCEEYHRVLNTDPSYEVNPFTALFDMLIIGMLHPLGYIGKQLGSFFDGVLNSATAFNTIPVFVAVLLGLFIFLIMTFGYEIHSPMFKLRPSPSVVVPPPGVIQALTHGSRIGGHVDQIAYLERHISAQQTYSQVQVLEERVQDSIEDCAENSTISPVNIEELMGSVLFTQTDIETNTSMLVPSLPPGECSPGQKEKLQNETSTTVADCTPEDTI